MILRTVFALWVAAVTLASVYFGQQFVAGPAAGEEGGVDSAPFDFFKTELVAVPYVHGNRIVGYIMGRFTVKMDPALESGWGISSAAAVLDAMNRHFFAEGEVLSKPEGWTQLRRSLDDLRNLANESAGRDVILEVLIDQLDFFDKDEVRMPNEVASDPTAPVPTKSEPAAAPSAAH